MSLPDQIFTTIKLEDGNVFALERHLSKLKEDYNTLYNCELNIDEESILKLLSEKIYQRGLFRVNLFAGKETTYKITKETPKELNTYSIKTYSSSFYEKFSKVKKSDFSQRLRLLGQAKERGFDDYLFYNEEGHFLETCICNLFWIHNKTLFTPSFQLPLYFGTTLQLVIEIAKEIGFEICFTFEKDLSKLQKSFVFVTNSMKEILPVGKINEHKLKIDFNLLEELKKSLKREKTLLCAL